MSHSKKIKAMYNCTPIISTGELYPLQKWYNTLIEKTCDEISLSDILRMFRQKMFLDLAILKAIEILKRDIFAGELYAGELLEKISQQDTLVISPHADILREIVKNATDMAMAFEWSYQGEREEFLEVLELLQSKL